MIKDEKIGVILGFKISFYEKFKEILNNNYQKIIKDQISSYMSFKIENFISAPNESLSLNPVVDNNGSFQNLYLKWGDSNIAVFERGNDITQPSLKPILDQQLFKQDDIKLIEKKINNWFKDTYISKLDLSSHLDKFNSKPEERSFIFKIKEGSYNLYQSNILDEFKKLEEPKEKKFTH